jgi:hypothetical protein
MISAPQDIWQSLETFLVVTNGVRVGLACSVEARDAVKHLTVHRKAHPTPLELSGPKC